MLFDDRVLYNNWHVPLDHVKDCVADATFITCDCGHVFAQNRYKWICPECSTEYGLSNGQFLKFESHDCPDCGIELVKRKSKNGNLFWGCPNFPACRHTETYRGGWNDF